jgi:hypothetical protein
MRRDSESATLARVLLDESGKCQSLDTQRRMFVMIGQGCARSAFILSILAIESSGPETAT